MGAWGIKINESDAYSDVYEFFFELYNSGETPIIASKETQESLSEYFHDYEDSNSSWFALAFAQWETNSLEANILEKVVSLVNSGADLKLLKELGANESQLKRRSQHLEKYIEKISKPKSSAKRRQKKKFEFKVNELVNILSPDGLKRLTVCDEYTDGKYVHTSALVMWASGGGSVFYYSSEGLNVEAKWLSSSALEVKVPKGINFSKQDFSIYFCGDTVSLIYIMV